MMADQPPEESMNMEVEQSGKNCETSELNPERRRKRPRPRRKRKMGKGQFRNIIPASVRAQQVRHEMFVNGQPVAPYNTTQFLIEDHGDLQNIDAQLSSAPGAQKHGRTRDSSFSIDSDDDYFYSSPEDEEEFLTKEFSLEYQDLHVERLNSLPKSDIIRDYLLLESKYEKSMAELRKLKGEEPGKVTDSGRDTDASSRSDVDVNEMLRLGNAEIRRLKTEVEKLKRENAQLNARRETRRDSETSVDSESDSSSSSSSGSSVSGSDSSKSPEQCINETSAEETAATAPEDVEDICAENAECSVEAALLRRTSPIPSQCPQQSTMALQCPQQSPKAGNIAPPSPIMDPAGMADNP